jgi:diguanylate cyclase (GGDEF)-like protein/PAS domain S-box-containing protein
MKKENPKSGQAADLRRRAEKRLSKKKAQALQAMSGEDARALVHELQVHQIELEMQNEELRRAQEEIEASRNKYSDLYDFAPVGYFTFDKKGLIREVNLTGARLLGIERRLLISKPFSLFVDANSQDIFHVHRMEVLKQKTPQTCEVILRRKNSSIFYAQLQSIAAKESEGNALNCRTAVTDITERKRVEEALRGSQYLIQRIAEATPNILFIFDIIEIRLIYANRALTEVLGYTQEEIQQLGAASYQRLIYPEDLPIIDRRSRQLSEAGDSDIVESEFRIKHADGEWRWLSAREIVFTRTEYGSPKQILGIALDITERKKMEEILQHRADHDNLTDLPNRALFTDRLILEMTHAHRNQTKVAVFFFDLDRFKNINDSMGHAAGDEVLRKVAGRLKACMRESDTAARIGGDEFAMLLTDIAHIRDVSKVADKIMSAFSEPFGIHDKKLTMTTSIGISVYPDDGQHAEELMKNADRAMYQAKEKGRNNYQFYAPHK